MTSEVTLTTGRRHGNCPQCEVFTSTLPSMRLRSLQLHARLDVTQEMAQDSPEPLQIVQLPLLEEEALPMANGRLRRRRRRRLAFATEATHADGGRERGRPSGIGRLEGRKDPLTLSLETKWLRNHNDMCIYIYIYTCIETHTLPTGTHLLKAC